MRFCVFCGRQGVTRKHIISTAVQKRMQLSDVEIEIGVRDEAGVNSEMLIGEKKKGQS